MKARERPSSRSVWTRISSAWGLSAAIHGVVLVALEGGNGGPPLPPPVDVVPITLIEFPSVPTLETPAPPIEASPPMAPVQQPPAPPSPTMQPPSRSARSSPRPIAKDIAKPHFGLKMQGTVSAPGGTIPIGDPGRRTTDHDDPPVVKSSARVIGASEPPATDDGCTEKPTKPKALHVPEPGYSESARSAGIAGVVRVEASIDREGIVSNVRVLSSLHPDLDTAALRAIEQATFEPSRHCGKPIPATFKISITFTL